MIAQLSVDPCAYNEAEELGMAMGIDRQDLRERAETGQQSRLRVVRSTACAPLQLHGITVVGLMEAAYGMQVVRWHPPFSHLLVCTAGHGQVLVDGQWQTCDEGTAYIAPPRVLHAYHAEPEARWHYCWVEYARDHKKSPLFPMADPDLISVDPWPLHSLVMGLYREYIGPADPAMIHHWTELVHLHVTRITCQPLQDVYLWRMWEQVDAELARPWSLKEMAALACVGVEQLRTLCHQHFGRSPGRQLTYLRMQYSAHLLRHTGQTVEVIAHTVGYDDPFAFSEAFKRLMHMTPSAYRACPEPID